MSIRSAFKSKFRTSFDRESPGFRESSRDKELSVLHSPSNGAMDVLFKPSTDEVEMEGSVCAADFKDCMDEDTIVAGASSVSGHTTNGLSHPPSSNSPPRTTPGGATIPSSFVDVRARGVAFRTRDEKAVYELQLNQLQEQLVAAMIESQNLGNEVKALKEKTYVDKLQQQLENERERNRMLGLQLRETQMRAKPSTLQSDDSDDDMFRIRFEKRPLRKRLKYRDRSASDCTDGNFEDDYIDLGKDSDLFPERQTKVTPAEAAKPPGRFHTWIVNTIYEVIEDFTEETSVTEPQTDSEGDPLTVKQLKENLKRFYSSTRPIMTTVRGVRAILSWETPSMTVLVLALYVYSVWRGWLLPVTLFLVILRLSINWLKLKGLITNFHYLPREDEKEEVEDKDSGVGDKFNLVLQVARKVQNGLGDIADSLEKIENLLMWRHQAATRQLVFVLVVGFILSLCLDGKVLFQLCGFYLALKLFVIDYIYGRFPRVRLRHDTTLRLWMELPTNAELNKRNTRAELHQYILPPSPLEETELLQPPHEYTSNESLSSDDRLFLELFSLPKSEYPLSAWQGGRRCTLINREKSLTSAFKSGKLYLTRSFICFERTKSTSPKNLVIPLGDITKIEKAKPYSWMPGGGMAMEVHVSGINRPLMFGALLNRDEIYESIMSVGMKAGLSWAPMSFLPSLQSTTDGSTGTTNTGQARSPGPMLEKLKLGIQYLEDSD